MSTLGSVVATEIAIEPKSISKKTGILVVALCWLAIFSEGYDVGVLGAILPSLATDPNWKLTPIELGAFGSYTLIGMLVGGLSIGTLSDLYGRRPTFIGCLTLFSACMVVAAWAPTPTWFAVSRIIAGLGLGGIIPVAAALTTQYSLRAPEEPELRHHVFRLFDRYLCRRTGRTVSSSPTLWLASGSPLWGQNSRRRAATDVLAAA